MPATEVWRFKDRKGEVPLKDWLESLQKNDPNAWIKCLQRITLLAEKGFELRRPLADYLRDAIYELRVRHGRKNYRMLYFFLASRRNVAVVSHGLEKEGRVPDEDIERAIKNKELVDLNSDKYTDNLNN